MNLETMSAAEQFAAIAKGLIQPTDLRIGGVLRPEQADQIIWMIFEDNFLSKITTQTVQTLKKEIDILNIQPRQLKRVAEGTEPTDQQKTGVEQLGSVYEVLPMQLFADISLSTVRDNGNRPDFVTELNGKLNSIFQNDITDLAVNGVADTYSGSAFLNLNKGWIQLATDSSRCPKVTIAPATDGWAKTLLKIAEAANPVYQPSSTFIMNPLDIMDYQFEVGMHVTGGPLITTNGATTFMAMPITDCRYMPRNKVLYTPLNNLFIAMHREIRRDSAWHPRKRIWELTFDMAADYEIAIKDACVLGKTA